MKINKDNVKKLEEAFAIGADIRAACAYADISRQCYYNWTAADPKLQEKFDTLRERPVLKAYQTIMKNLDSADMAKWYLERKRKKAFSLRTELTGADGANLPQPILYNALPSNNSDSESKRDETKD